MYIKKRRNTETGEKEFWLSNLPKDENLFDKINKLRIKHQLNKFIITEKINLSGKIIDKKMYLFGDCLFIKEVDFSNCIFNKNVTFRYVTFDSKVNFDRTEFKTNVEFKNNTFNSEAKFNNAHFLSKADFSGNYFYSKAELEETKFDSTSCFWDSHFYSEISFREAIFSSETYFQEVEFHLTANFAFTEFKNLAIFSRAIFKTEIIFPNITILGKMIFSRTIFEQEVQFLYCIVGSNVFISFEGAIFKKCLDISRSNFHYSNLRFWNIKIEGNENISQYTNYINDFGKEKIEPSVHAKIRETYRTIKNAFYKEDNRIEGLEFYKKEMDVYREELKMKRKEIKEHNNPSPPSSNKIWLIIKDILNFLNNIIHKSLKFLSDIRQKKAIAYHSILSIIFIVLVVLYTFLKNHYFFWGSVILFIIWMYIEFYISRKNIKNSIKENNFMPLITLLFSTILVFSPLYSKIPYNNDCIFKAFTSIKIHTEQFYELFLKKDDVFFSIITVISIIFFAISMAIAFHKRDRILLWFNKNSNNFGTNWMVGVNFTLCVGLITYLLILIPISHKLEPNFEPEGIGLFLRYYGELLNPLKWNEIKPFGEELGSWQYIIAFIGRIFIGYGYYQTIQAFRKYGKSS